MAARKGKWDSGNPGITAKCGLLVFLVVAHGRGRERGKTQGNLQRMFWRRRQRRDEGCFSVSSFVEGNETLLNCSSLI